MFEARLQRQNPQIQALLPKTTDLLLQSDLSPFTSTRHVIFETWRNRPLLGKIPLPGMYMHLALLRS